MTRVLLVTGARSLASHPGAEVWARGLIHAALTGTDLLIVGDAPGPDAWAWEVAAGHIHHMRRYLTRGPDAGMIAVLRITRDWTSAEWSTVRWTEHGDTGPLARNRAMVRAVAEMRGRDVRVLALLDGLKRDAPGRRATRGTEHTAALAERAGITVRREVWR